MRHRVSLAMVALMGALALSATAVYAQEPGGGEVSQEATSEMVGGTVQTEAVEVVELRPASPARQSAPSGGTAGDDGSGDGGSGDVGSGGGSGGDSSSNGVEFQPDPGIPVPEPALACFDEAMPTTGAILVPLGGCPGTDEPAAVGEGGAEPVLVDPLVLAFRAFSEMSLPSPVPGMSPSLDEGTYAQLATFFYLEDWGPLSNSAAAGSVTATATAVPVRQTWTIRDGYRGSSESITCDGPGAPFDPSRSYEAQLPPECGWTPRHSSAGQSGTGGQWSEPCFSTTVSLSWAVSWTSNIGAGGDLGVATTSTETCLVVAEIQALVTAEGR